MGRRRPRWKLVTALTAAASLSGAAVAFAQFISYTDHSRALLEGNWQSCRESNGRYSERIYDNTLPGIGPFELHLGPYHEFALFRGVQDEHRPHDSAGNLLHPFDIEVSSNRARHSWEAAGLRLDVNLGGGSDDQCESWFLSLKRTGGRDSE
jgi:hypothetical protein